ncbi:acyl carrier protein [Streptomyces sp. H39-S7]|uniref:acyl carrier protein n=1 Tax=Streptomyces sp. H39-S7 TaxID=3004357 RepID=UPI0022AE8C63|nr:acyl carrier protein [Streptomyces sp. H39-S7]MCZ4120290.1 acyl carrier protein [Streptomyces sp. H39-S7]
MNGDLAHILLHDLKLPAHQLTLDATLDDAGFDSLARVELSLLLRDRFSIDISDDDIKRAPTLRHLDHLIQNARDER